MEYKFSAFKRPKLADFFRDFIGMFDFENDFNCVIKIQCEGFFKYTEVTFDCDYESLEKFVFEANANLEVISVKVTSDKRYLIKCC